MEIERAKDLVGKKVKLLKMLRTKGGQTFHKGRTMRVDDKWKGWGLCTLRPDRKTGCIGSITHVRRDSFEVLG